MPQEEKAPWECTTCIKRSRTELNRVEPRKKARDVTNANADAKCLLLFVVVQCLKHEVKTINNR